MKSPERVVAENYIKSALESLEETLEIDEDNLFLINLKHSEWRIIQALRSMEESGGPALL